MSDKASAHTSVILSIRGPGVRITNPAAATVGADQQQHGNGHSCTHSPSHHVDVDQALWILPVCSRK